MKMVNKYKDTVFYRIGNFYFQVFIITFIDWIDNKTTKTKTRTMQLFKKAGHAVAPRSVLSDFDSFVKEGARKREWAEGTLIRWKTFRGHLEKFRKHLFYNHFDENGLDDYVDFLTNTLGLRNSTVSKELRLLKWFLKWAEQKGYNNVKDYSYYHPKLKMVRNPVVFLTKEEVMKLYSLNIPRHYPSAGMLARTRDMFCFCCFTSLRYSDMAKLTVSAVQEDRLSITTQKTNSTLSIELNKYAKEILGRYTEGKSADRRVFPNISCPHMNMYLKELGQLCGLDKPVTTVHFKGSERIEKIVPKWQMLSTHCARRSFICNALSSGVNAQTIMKWTGHSDYSAMMPYIDVTDEEKATSMQKIFE